MGKPKSQKIKPQIVTQKFLDFLKKKVFVWAKKALDDEDDSFIVIPNIYYYDLEYDTKGFGSEGFAWVRDNTLTDVVVKRLEKLGFKTKTLRMSDGFALIAEIPDNTVEIFNLFKK